MMFTTWPDHGCPDNTDLLLDFVLNVRVHMPSGGRQHGPVLVHCRWSYDNGCCHVTCLPLCSLMCILFCSRLAAQRKLFANIRLVGFRFPLTVCYVLFDIVTVLITLLANEHTRIMLTEAHFLIDLEFLLVSTLAVVLKRASFVQAWKQSVTVQPPSRILLHFIIACISNKLCAIPGGAYPKSFPLSAHFLVWYDFNEINRWPHTANIKSEARGSTTSWLACCRSLQV